MATIEEFVNITVAGNSFISARHPSANQLIPREFTKLLWQGFIHLNAKVGIDDDTDDDVKALTDAANQQDEFQGAIFNQTLAKMYALNFSTLEDLRLNSPDYSEIPRLFWLVSSQ